MTISGTMWFIIEGRKEIKAQGEGEMKTGSIPERKQTAKIASGMIVTKK